MNIIKNTAMIIALFAALLIIYAPGMYVFAQETSSQPNTPAAAFTAGNGKPAGAAVADAGKQAGDRLNMRSATLPNPLRSEDDGDSTSYAMITTRQTNFYNRHEDPGVLPTGRGSNDEIEPADNHQAGNSGTLVGPEDDVTGMIWQEVSGNSRYRLVDATVYPGLFSQDSGNDLRRYSLMASLSASEFESGAHAIDITIYNLASFKGEKRQYWYSSFDDLGPGHGDTDAEYSVNLFTIDIHGHVSGIAGMVTGMFH